VCGRHDRLTPDPSPAQTTLGRGEHNAEGQGCRLRQRRWLSLCPPTIREHTLGDIALARVGRLEV
jgi:hypothetical protein